MKKFLLLMLLWPVLSYSKIYEHQEPFTGARPLGMGSAFIAVSDDSSAVSYNPAGLAGIKYSQIGWMYSPVYISGFFRSYANFVLPLGRFYVIGLDWYHTGYDDTENGAYGVPELSYSEGKVNAGFGTRLANKLFMGFTLKVLYMSAAMDGETQGRGTGYNLNLGLLYQLNEKLRLGLTGNNLIPSFTDTKKWGMTIRYENGTENMKYEPSIRLGAAYSPVKNLNLALDLLDPLCFGAEYWFFSFLGLRGGTKYSMLNSNITLTGGISFRYWIGQLDYALNYNSALNLVHNFGFSAVWGYQAYLIDVVSVDMQGIFPSIYKSYAQKDVVRIKLKNKSQKPLQAKVGFEAEKIMKAPTEKKIFLKPNVISEIVLPVVFSEDITETRDDSVVSGNVILSYRVEDRESKDVNAQKFTLYSRNAMVWDDMDKIASFVTPQDEKVIEFTRYILQSYKAAGSYIVSKNFHRAMLMFNALGTMGVTYVPDPNNPFATSSQNIDYIQFPQETLNMKTGDCDDCTVLYCALLESIGIRTAALITSDHIFMMFDSGVLPEEA
ncbi:MAG: conjugal transfer protein TraF, partial [bacterium]|nr:conjugal transfer protein TraF [bacterium]